MARFDGAWWGLVRTRTGSCARLRRGGARAPGAGVGAVRMVAAAGLRHALRLVAATKDADSHPQIASAGRAERWRALGRPAQGRATCPAAHPRPVQTRGREARAARRGWTRTRWRRCYRPSRSMQRRAGCPSAPRRSRAACRGARAAGRRAGGQAHASVTPPAPAARCARRAIRRRASVRGRMASGRGCGRGVPVLAGWRVVQGDGGARSSRRGGAGRASPTAGC